GSWRRTMEGVGTALLLFVQVLSVARPAAAEQGIRIGYFPNITHAQPIVGLRKGFFQTALGPAVKITTRLFNAGPSEIEALFAGEIDLGYIGPNPAINGFIKSRRKALRIIAGATSGGAVFVVRKEADGRLFLDERERWPGGRFVTAQVIASTAFLTDHPELVRRWLDAHIETTQWITAHLAEAKTILNEGIAALTSKALAPDVLNDAFSRLEVTYDPVGSSLQKSADDAYTLGFLRDKNLDGIYDLTLLNEVLAAKGLEPVQVAVPN